MCFYVFTCDLTFSTPCVRVGMMSKLAELVQDEIGVT